MGLKSEPFFGVEGQKNESIFPHFCYPLNNIPHFGPDSIPSLQILITFIAMTATRNITSHRHHTNKFCTTHHSIIIITKEDTIPSASRSLHAHAHHGNPQLNCFTRPFKKKCNLGKSNLVHCSFLSPTQCPFFLPLDHFSPTILLNPKK